MDDQYQRSLKRYRTKKSYCHLEDLQSDYYESISASVPYHRHKESISASVPNHRHKESISASVPNHRHKESISALVPNQRHKESISALVSYHHHKAIKSSRRSSSFHRQPVVEIAQRKESSKKKLNKNTKNTKTYSMSCFIIILVVGIIVSLIITVAWESCQELPQLNGEDMVQALSSIVFGQELAIHIVVLALQIHLKKLEVNIYKPLLLSFHGGSGTGKTFLSSQISHFFPANTKVLKYYPSIHFKGGETADVHEKAISTWINKNFNPCTWNIIIVDDAQDVTEEVQKAFKKVFSNMKESWLYRKLIVIFVSNLYSSQINDVVFHQKNRRGQSTFHMSDFDSIFERGPSNWLVELYREGLLDTFVPFLPLHKSSVLKCIEQELKKYKKTPIKEIVNEISNEIVFYTLEWKGDQYSISGCKKVADKVTLWTNSVPYLGI